MYAKLFSRITESSLMEQPIGTRYVFMALLAIADPKGHIIGTDVALARRVNIPLLDFQEAVQRLMLPDPDSNSAAEGGRRIVLSDCGRGYRLVNYLAYRNARDEDHRREYMRQLMADKRAKARGGGGTLLAPVSSVSTCERSLAQAEAEAEADTKREKEPAGCTTPGNRDNGSIPTLEDVLTEARMRGVPEDHARGFFDFNQGKNLWLNKHSRLINWRYDLRTWSNKARTMPTNRGIRPDHSKGF
ncbi:MAG TPA: hypothetical protein VN673_17050 [Clostridia bacterium]|nr:hypothetical protein [Clostridia bacterium]